MATSVSGGAGNDLVIPDDAATSVEISATDDGALIDVTSNVKDINIEVGGEAPVTVEGKAVKNSVVRPTPKVGETAQIIFDTTKISKTVIISEGPGAVEVEVEKGTFKKSTIDLSASEGEDSIAFGGDTKVVGASITLGNGKDTVVFKEGIKLKGDTAIKVGDGKDTIEVPEEVKGGGRIGISNFSKKDKLVVDGQKLKGKKLYNGRKELPDYIAIQFEDGTTISGFL
ncbi:hypothetical protein SynA15127_02406 [Synechococcus sp. A15-127]|uniref:hypothetical protein n=1 Tax=Synechococcus sp. A15-127 TaxID=1050624 RepID=UPI0016454D44|nr:hypothetical protein [Synechococcus sp. A15-127]QNI95470.1 hypothetical protein SynA15127_02406 [Synechococcus sp. A15-127]